MVSRVIPVDDFDLVIFGATGDLAQRKILPGLYRRFVAGQIPATSRIIGAARTEQDDAAFRAEAAKAAAAILVVLVLNRPRLTRLRETLDAGASASVLPIFAVASLVGFGAVVAALPAFELVRDWVLSIQGGPLVSMAVATNILAALTGSASGGLTIALDALGPTYLERAAELGIDPQLLHRVAVMSAGTLDSLPHSGAVVTLLSVCGVSARQSYRDIVMVAIVGALLALVAVIALGTLLGSF